MRLKVEQLQAPSTKVAAAAAGGMEATTIAITTLLRCPAGQPSRNSLVKIDEAAGAPQPPPAGKDDLCASDAWSRANLPGGLPSFINFVSMDVEGLELEILKFWPFDAVRVGAW